MRPLGRRRGRYSGEVIMLVEPSKIMFCWEILDTHTHTHPKKIIIIILLFIADHAVVS